MRPFAKPLAISSVLLASSGASGICMESSLREHPDAATARFYAEHEKSVDALLAKVRDVASPIGDRLAALDDLQVSYPEAATEAAIELISNANEQIAVAAAKLLSASIAMSDHGVRMQPVTEKEKALMAWHERAREALRGALGDTRRPVREVAAETLSSLSDRPSLDILAKGAESGAYSQSEAVNYFGLAKAEVGAPYLERALKSPDKAARSGAVAYLAANPNYQDKIRDQVLLNPAADAQVRVVAAKRLSQFDPSFSEYALTVTSDPSVPVELYSQVVQGYIDQSEARGQVNAAQIKVLKSAVENFRAKAPASFELKGLQQRLDELVE
jgi:hypothetical protein